MRELLDSICSPGYRDGLAMLFVMLGLSCLLVRTPRRKRPGQWLMIVAFGVLLITFALGFSASLLGLGRRLTEFVNLSVIRYLIAMPLLFAGAVWESTRYPLKVTGGNPSVPSGGLTPTAQDAVRLRQSLSRRKRELESAQEQLDLQSSEANEAAAQLKDTLNLLLVSQERSRILFSSSGDGLLIADLSSGVVEEVNDRLGEMVGYPADLLREKDLSAVFGPRVGSLGSRRIRELADEHEPMEILIDQGGGSVPVELRFSVIEAGEKSVLLAVARDNGAHEAVDGSVNESLSLELEKKNEALEEQGRVLKEANRLISERAEKMRVMNEKLLELQTVKDDFLSSVSHELRTPLTSIQSFSEILLSNEDAEDEVKKEFIAIINKESERLSRLINDVLDLAKIEAGQHSFRLTEVDLAEIARDVARSLAPQAENRGMTITIDIPADLPPVEGDRDKLQQVFTNLVSNSLKFANSGTTVCVDAQPKGDGTVEVSVADEGPGIAEEELESIFDKFRQVGDTLTEKPEGSGLGLAICREIVGLHGGHIWARSMLSRGSTFYFTVRAVPQAPAEAVETPVAPAVEETADEDETLPMAIVIEVPDFPEATAPEPVPTVAPAPAAAAPAPAPAGPEPASAAASREEDTPSFEDAAVAGSLPPLRLRKPKKPEGGRGLPPMQS